MRLESCSRRVGIDVHDALETLTTMSRNMHRAAARRGEAYAPNAATRSRGWPASEAGQRSAAAETLRSESRLLLAVAGRVQRQHERPGLTKNTEELDDGFEVECPLAFGDGGALRGAFAVLGFLAARARNSPAYHSPVVLGRIHCEALSQPDFAVFNQLGDRV